jgi:gas vesicle protein
MTDINQSGTGFSDSDSSQGTAEVAREQAAHVAETAQESGQHVVETAKEEAANVAQEAKSQVGDLFAQTGQELKDQAAKQQERVASGLRSVSDELGQMARSSEGGMATDLVHQAASKTGEIASWLDQRDPGSLLDEVKSFARRRPGTFIAAAAIAGVLAGRLTRSIAGGASASASGTPATGQSTTPPVQHTSAPTFVPVSTEDASAAPWGQAEPLAPGDPLAGDPLLGTSGSDYIGTERP